MARMIKITETGPAEIKPSEKSQWACMCGLSANKPFCDGSHKIARQQEDPDKLYVYKDNQPVEIDE